MRHFACYGDDRNKNFCVHCGGPDETKDHLPSKVLLDEPLPANVFVSPACFSCNNGLAPDEEYVAALIECVLAGEGRPQPASGGQRSQRRSPASVGLAERLRRARRLENGMPVWGVEQERMRNVVLKLARGHAAYELNDPRTEEPDVCCVRPIPTMTRAEFDRFEDRPDPGTIELGVWPEVGSRMMSRLLIVENEVYDEGWLVVQEGALQVQAELARRSRRAHRHPRIPACQVVWE